jgi:hypothetical protein
MRALDHSQTAIEDLDEDAANNARYAIGEVHGALVAELAVHIYPRLEDDESPEPPLLY